MMISEALQNSSAGGQALLDRRKLSESLLGLLRSAKNTPLLRPFFMLDFG